jgi:hypothetical protein
MEPFAIYSQEARSISQESAPYPLVKLASSSANSDGRSAIDIAEGSLYEVRTERRAMNLKQWNFGRQRQAHPFLNLASHLRLPRAPPPRMPQLHATMPVAASSPLPEFAIACGSPLRSGHESPRCPPLALSPAKRRDQLNGPRAGAASLSSPRHRSRADREDTQHKELGVGIFVVFSAIFVARLCGEILPFEPWLVNLGARSRSLGLLVVVSRHLLLRFSGVPTDEVCLAIGCCVCCVAVALPSASPLRRERSDGPPRPTGSPRTRWAAFSFVPVPSAGPSLSGHLGVHSSLLLSP